MDFKMSIKYDEENNEFYLAFLDEDDRKKKSRYLKRLLESKTSVVTMTILEDSDSATKSQHGMYDAFLYLLKEYTGDDLSDVKSTIYSFLQISEEEINRYDKKQFSDFIERLFQMCAENIGIVVEQNQEGKLKIIKND